ncbi:MAG TPA: hypothetical protein VFL13_10035, partial [Candidatus Baltobacteraceae bacterium]|nr:hypothetical protein [Candidatus Baltobacteraceae bacterium]
TRNDPATEGPTGGPIELDETSAEVYPYVSAIAPSPLNSRLIWAGSADGLVHYTTDHGAHWTKVALPDLPQYAEISSIEPSRTAQGTAYLTAQRYMWDDFHPYVYKTTDYGAHWTSITSGIPDDEYVFVVREDPRDPRLVFAGTRNSVYVSFNGGNAWEPLALNLPGVQVRDIAVNARQGEVAIATHGRAFWVLDNLAFLEDAQRRGEAADAASRAALFQPETAWLTHFAGGSPYPRPETGQNPAFGATVFFNLPRSYNGTQPATLTFSDANGRAIHSFNLHRASRQDRVSPERLGAMVPAEMLASLDRLQTGAVPGMNKFVWDLRYPRATEVNGFYTPVAAGGEEDTLDGPTIVPGNYRVTLRYDGRSFTETLHVALDPNLHPAPGGLAARFALQRNIWNTLDEMDKAINAALARRAALSADKRAALDTEIDKLVNLKTHSSEGPLSTGTRTRDHLAYLLSDTGYAYDAPTPAQYAVYDQLRAEALAGEARLLELSH